MAKPFQSNAKTSRFLFTTKNICNALSVLVIIVGVAGIVSASMERTRRQVVLDARLRDAIHLPFNGVDEVPALLAAGANPNSQVANWNGSLLFASAQSGSLRNIRSLLNADAKMPIYSSPLFAVANCGVPACDVSERTEIVRLFLARGADIKVRDSFGVTPLGAAAMAHNVESVRAFLRFGNTTGLDRINEDSFRYGETKNQRQIFALLKSHGALRHDK